MQTKHNLIIADRYELGEPLSTTALGKFFCAHDFISAHQDDAPKQVIMLAVAPEIAAYPNFHDVMPRVIEGFTQKNSPLKVAGTCEFQGVYWIVLDEPCTELLLHKLIESCSSSVAIAMERVQPLLLGTLQAAKQISHKNGFGFIEPGAILCKESQYVFLNAPVVIALRILTSLNAEIKPKISIYSAYCSPQAARGILPTHQDDTFSIACIAYQILHDSPPFGALSTLEAYEKKTSPSLLTNLPPESQKSLQRGLALERYERQTSPYELVHAFTSIPMNNDATQQTTSRFARPVTIAAVPLILLLLTGIYQFYQQSLPAIVNPIATTITPNLESSEKLTIATPDTHAVSITANRVSPTEQPILSKEMNVQPVTPIGNAVLTATTTSTEKQIVETTAQVVTKTTTENKKYQPVEKSTQKPLPDKAQTPIKMPHQNNNVSMKTQATVDIPAPTDVREAPPPPIPVAVVTPPAPPITISQPITHPKPTPATTAVVIPVTESTFVVGSPPATSPKKKVQPTQVTPQGDNVFIVMPD
ncbi:MAG: hypothetical protein QJT81_09775 [Candidatus Thiothrix putei]|uniref:Protein kinase domain-containing protein n=1 Tax=Candidatus Thiothrix putei TaxID=3080811 RepID=A0AA95HLP1_9GAMM|nr:MAG: hypothetical protein QJT81_09775 [Candidatus Thiothrix putei]